MKVKEIICSNCELPLIPGDSPIITDDGYLAVWCVFEGIYAPAAVAIEGANFIALIQEREVA